MARLDSPIEMTIDGYLRSFCLLFSELAAVCGVSGTKGLRKLDNACSVMAWITFHARASTQRSNERARHHDSFATRGLQNVSMKVRDAIKLVEADGWKLTRTRGSHHGVNSGLPSVVLNFSMDL
jgi:hypothetical protein